MQEIMMNKIIPISKKVRKKLRLARYPALLHGFSEINLAMVAKRDSDARTKQRGDRAREYTDGFLTLVRARGHCGVGEIAAAEMHGGFLC
jgi:hypothetical protein